jgi:hypothetical protein
MTGVRTVNEPVAAGSPLQLLAEAKLEHDTAWAGLAAMTAEGDASAHPVLRCEKFLESLNTCSIFLLTLPGKSRSPGFQTKMNLNAA